MTLQAVAVPDARRSEQLSVRKLRDSGVQGLGPIPSDWEVWKIGHLVRLTSGETLVGDKIDTQGPVPVYGGNGLRGYFTKSNHSGTYVLIGRQGALCGNVNYAHGEFWATEHALVVYPQTDLNIRWLGESLRHMNLNQYSVAAAQPGLSVPNITCLRLPVPPLDEQTQIAKFLDYETAKIDKLIDKQQQLIALLKEKRQAVISHAVTKGLNPDALLKDSGVEWLGKVPAHWDVAKCGYYLSILNGFAFSSAGFVSGDGGTRLLRGINVGVGRIRWDDVVCWQRIAGDGLDEYELVEGDVVLGMDRPVVSEGVRVAKVESNDTPCLLLQRVACLRPTFRINTDFLMHLLMSDMFGAHFSPETTGVSVPHISPSQIADFAIPLPPRSEQDQIIQYLASQLERLDRLVVAARESADLLTERRSALISAAVTGKIDVRNWRPPETDAEQEVA